MTWFHLQRYIPHIFNHRLISGGCPTRSQAPDHLRLTSLIQPIAFWVESPVEGVWKVAEVTPASSNTTEKPTPITNPQPGLMIFTKGYYSVVAVTGRNARTSVEAKDPQNLTDAEKLAFYEQWRAFAANFGTYEINGSTLIRRASVAKNVGVMTGQEPLAAEFKMEGPNTLWLIPPADRPNDPRVKWTRVE